MKTKTFVIIFKSNFFMKKLSLALTFVCTLLFVFNSCSDEDEPNIVEELSFTVNGRNVSFSDPNGGFDIFDDLIVTGSTEGSEETITLRFLNPTKGTFTEEDIDDSLSSTANNYNIEYTDSGENFYRYSGSADGDFGFTITVAEFSTTENGLVEGTFSGVLSGSLFNGDDVAETATITNGKFKVQRRNATLELLY